jgi:peptidoglycan hydrolase FlgJ
MPNSIHSLNGVRPALNKTAVENRKARKDQGELGKACDDFEALFVKYMMQQMRETIPKDGLFGQSQAEKIYTGMLDDEVAKSISHGRGLGLAKAMYEQMAALQGDDTRKK